MLPWRPQITFGERLRLVRKQHGDRTGQKLSQRAFSALLGVQPGNYAQWEADNNLPRDLMGLVSRCREVTGCDESFLYGIEPGSGPGGGSDVPGLPTGRSVVTITPRLHHMPAQRAA